MGFNANPTTYILDFSETPFEGMEVRVRRGSVQIRYDFDHATTWREELEIFQKVLVGWNLVDDDGAPWPLTVDALLATEDAVVKAILDAWIAAGRPPAPLEQPSTPGETGSVPPQPAATTDLALEATMHTESLAS